MKKFYFAVHFPSFGPIFIWETSVENAMIRARYQRLEEGISTLVMAVQKQSESGEWVNCGLTERESVTA